MLVGVIRLLLGLLLSVPILWVVGLVLLLVGAVLWIAGAAGHELAGLRHSWWSSTANAKPSRVRSARAMHIGDSRDRCGIPEAMNSEGA
jgi:hypothetical protein